MKQGRAFRHEGAWIVTARPHVVIKLKAWFPRADSQRKGGIKLLDTPEMCRELEWLIERFAIEVGPADLMMLHRNAERHREREREVDRLLTGRAEPMDGLLEPIRPARDYQLVAADLALTVKRGLLLGDELGTGKTMSGMLALRDDALLPALVCCPTHLWKQWVHELAITFPTLCVHVLQGLRPYDPAGKRASRGHDPDVLICPYSRVRGWGDALRGKVRAVILDEVQEARRVDSDKYVALMQICDAAELVMGMSATPVFNYGAEVHNIFELLAPGVLGSREEFGREWCGGTWGPKARVEDPGALHHYLREQGLLLVRTRKDVGRELPFAPQRITHAIDADMGIYDRMEEDTFDLAETILSGEDKQAAFAAAGDLDWALRKATGVAKAPYVAEFVKLLLEGGEPKVVVFGWHREVWLTYLRELGDYGMALYTGSESPAAKDYNRARFIGGETLDKANADRERRGQPLLPEVRVFGMSLRSGAGLNGLQQVCRTGVFGELDWSPGMHDQCEGRIDRDGQTDPVVSYFLVSNVGTDPLMAEVLQLKLPQGKLFVNPNAKLLQPVPDSKDRIRKLAEQVMARRQRRHPVNA